MKGAIFYAVVFRATLWYKMTLVRGRGGLLLQADFHCASAVSFAVNMVYFSVCFYLLDTHLHTDYLIVLLRFGLSAGSLLFWKTVIGGLCSLTGPVEEMNSALLW